MKVGKYIRVSDVGNRFYGMIGRIMRAEDLENFIEVYFGDLKQYIVLRTSQVELIN